MFGYIITVLAVVAPAQEADPGAAEKAELPTLFALALPELEGDFDADGASDTAIARQGDDGVEIALALSSLNDTVIEHLGADNLDDVRWHLRPAPDRAPPRDAIAVILRGGDRFLLVWNGEALETEFLDG